MSCASISVLSTLAAHWFDPCVRPAPAERPGTHHGRVRGERHYLWRATLSRHVLVTLASYILLRGKSANAQIQTTAIEVFQEY